MRPLWPDFTFFPGRGHPGRPPANAEDIVSTIAELIKTLPISTHIQWIKAHQDDDSTSKLSYEAEMNVTADKLA